MFGFVKKNREKVEKWKEDRKRVEDWQDGGQGGQCRARGAESHVMQFAGGMWRETESRGGGAIHAEEHSLKTCGEREATRDIIVEELKSAMDSIVTAWAMADTLP